MSYFSLRTVLSVLVITGILGGTAGLADVPTQVSYQGFLRDDNGAAVTDTLVMSFSLYDIDEGGTPLWTETQSDVGILEGVFNVFLGSVTPLDPAQFNGDPRWLKITVGGEDLSPRHFLGTVPYAFHAATADSLVAGGSADDGDWASNGADIYRLTGKVGIGTSTPDHLLSVAGGLSIGGVGSDDLDLVGTSASLPDYDGDSYGEKGVVVYTGGTGTSIRFRRSGTGEAGSGGIRWGAANADDFYLHRRGTNERLHLDYIVYSENPDTRLEVMTITQDGRVGIATTSPACKLHVDGTTRTKILKITDGADIAEPFDFSEENELPAGSIVVIDEEKPGNLRLGGEPYDKKVAGVISGAGGVNPGLVLSQDGMTENGQNVAIGGRVYVLASACNGAINPGDLLTTSSIPGHAMVATDAEKSHGAIIGKAMSRLESGKGLVLVLVNLH